MSEAYLEGKVEGLCGEVPDDIGQVTSPEGGKALLCCNTGKAVHDTSVPRDLTCKAKATQAIKCY